MLRFITLALHGKFEKSVDGDSLGIISINPINITTIRPSTAEGGCYISCTDGKTYEISDNYDEVLGLLNAGEPESPGEFTRVRHDGWSTSL